MRRPLSLTVIVAATLFGIAACSSAPADDAAPASTPASTPAATAVASVAPEPTVSALPSAAFSGDWTGTARQGESTHDVSINLVESPEGYSGTIRHVALQCSGTLTDGVVTETTLTIQKHIDVNGTCIVDLEVTLTLSDENTLIYNTEVSTAVLSKADAD